MKIKKEYIILAVIIIALSVYLVMRHSDRTLYELPKIPKVAKKEITRLQITRGDTVIELKKKDDRWYIEPLDYPADDEKVEHLLESLEDLTLTALVSESKNYNLYDLSPASEIHVKAWKGDTLERDIEIGKTAPSYRHTFVKPAGDVRVFHARGNLRNTFDTSPDALRDKMVLAFTPADIQEIEITNDQQTTVLNKTPLPEKETSAPNSEKADELPAAPKTVWQAPDGRTGDENVVNSLLNTLSNLHCEKFRADDAKEAMNAPQLTVRLKGPQEYRLNVFPKTEEKETQYPATSSGSKYAFFLPEGLVKNIQEDAAKVIKASEADSPPAKKTESK